MNESALIPLGPGGQGHSRGAAGHAFTSPTPLHTICGGGLPVPRWLNLFVSPRVVVRSGPGGPMDKAKMARVFVLGLLTESEVKGWWEAMDTVPGHKVMSFNRDETGYLVTYRYEPDEKALNTAVGKAVRYRGLRLLLGLPLRLLGLPRRS